MKKQGLLKKIVYGAVTFFGMLFCMLTLLVLTAKIPQKELYEKTLKSAGFLQEGELFGKVIEGINASRIDRYADSILLGIAWQYEAEHPLEAVMRSAYYHTNHQNENENLLEAVEKGLPANQQYLRYWHGSIMAVRPLLVVMSIEAMYWWHAALLILLTVALFTCLWRKGAGVLGLGVVAGMIFNSVWFVPFSLEYTWTVLWMLIFSILAWKLAELKKRDWYATMFLCSGMVTNFFDFLTTETLTLTVPLLVILWVEGRNPDTKEKDPKEIGILLGTVLAWGFGYAGMWIAKWVLAGIVLGENVMPYVTGHIVERIGGTKEISANALRFMFGAVGRNLKCLLPLEYGVGGILLGSVLALAYVYLAFVYHAKNADRKRIVVYLLIGMIPYLRYLVLHNHSYLHFFFTYRAQIGTILALVLVLDEWKVWENFRKIHRRGTF